MTTPVYERLDAQEVEQVRAYRRSLWADRAIRDPRGARDQIVAALTQHADPWVDGVHVTTLTSVAFDGQTIGDLTDAQRYSLVALLRDGQ